MKKLFLIISAFVALNAYSLTQAQSFLPNRNGLENTFNIASDTSIGTGFLIKNNNQEFLITARHLFRKKIKNNEEVLITVCLNNVNKVFKVKIYLHQNPNIDIAVLKIPQSISQFPSLLLKGGDSYFLAQECLFFGYPLNSLGSITKEGKKIPLVKRAIISAIYDENGIDYLLLDGHNNPGFSGGPLLTYSHQMENQYIIGVITAYYPQPHKIKLNDTIPPITFNENSGIIVAFPSQYILEILESIH